MENGNDIFRRMWRNREYGPNRTTNKLDSVLQYLNESYNKGMKLNSPSKHDAVWKTRSEILHDDHSVFLDNTSLIEAENEIDLILEYLIDVKEFIKEKNGKYSILWKGKQFIENGGYYAEMVLNEEENQRKRRNDKLLILGSWIAGIGAVGLCLIEIWKLIHAYFINGNIKH